MDFYEDVLTQSGSREKALPLRAHFHAWTPDSIANVWSIWANVDTLRSQFYPPHYYEAMLAEAAPHLGSPDLVVDIGCGTGTVLSILHKQNIGRRLTGVDLSDESLSALHKAFSGDSRVAFKVGAITATGLEPASCDLVVCTETLEHLYPADFSGGLTEIARILKPGGRMLATVPLEERPNFVACPECHAIFTPYQHMLFNFTLPSLARVLAANGMEIVHVIQPVDVGVPRRAWKRFMKDRIMRPLFPGLTRRLFRVAGVSGFVAVKRAATNG